MVIVAATGNDPLRQQRLANVTCFKYGQKGHYRKDCPNSAGTSLLPDKTSSMQNCSPPTTVIQTVTSLYAVPQSSLGMSER